MTLSEEAASGPPLLRSQQPWRIQYVSPHMGNEAEARVCAQCGRRYAKPEIIQSGRCPRCGGHLVALEETGDPDKPGGDDEGR